ncbi:electron transport complex protein RnfE [Hypnocyclicus thermotrophus]|uniref:Ion-translocating oxidoreductase complex subunit E n=1 Tax=Hypnocyclicus thermotrophus TaxID=1627895 RepID=A0AA46DYR1_9FUSO|nr:electron transport complex subunit E [Hypnocyclicus thermotrophus]TDT69872.1 electron transport complex protein RnfE [Hypnocyclicus thermotrophus]
MENRYFKEFSKGIVKENPVLVLLLGLCPTLGVTTSATNGLTMGLATLTVLVFSNMIVSMIKDFIPDKVRIPAFIMVIASLVTIVGMVMEAYIPALYAALGVFLPLIVVNCIILGRAESFASKNGIILSILDGLGNGLGFTFTLVLLGGIREILGNGSIFGIKFLGSFYNPALIFILPPGAFLTLGFIIATMNAKKNRSLNKKEAK